MTQNDTLLNALITELNAAASKRLDMASSNMNVSESTYTSNMTAAMILADLAGALIAARSAMWRDRCVSEGEPK